MNYTTPNETSEQTVSLYYGYKCPWHKMNTKWPLWFHTKKKYSMDSVRGVFLEK